MRERLRTHPFRRPRFLAAFPVAVAAMGLAWFSASDPALAQDEGGSATPANHGEELMEDPQVREALRKAVEGTLEAREKQAKEEMKIILADLQEDYGVEGEALTALETAAEKAVADSMEPWAEDFREFLRFQYVRMANRYAYQRSVILQQLNQARNTLTRFRSPEAALPRSQESWEKALAAQLTPAQYEEWKKEFAEDAAERKKALDEFLEELVASTKQNQLSQAEPVMRDLLRVTKADDTQRERLRLMINEIIEAQLEKWKEETTFVLDRVEENRWKSFAQMALPSEITRAPEWESGLDKILAGDQRQAWKDEVAKVQADIESKLDTMLIAEVSKQRSQFTPRMNRELEQLIEIVEPGAKVKKQFEAAAEAAIEESVEAWKRAGKALFFRLPFASRNSVLERNQFRYRPAMEGLHPDEQEAWTSAVETLLTPEQAITWQAEMAKRKEENTKRLADMVDATAESYRIQFETMLDPRISDVIGSLALDEARAKAFKDAGKEAIDQSLDKWKENAREWLDGLSESQREEYTRQGRVPLGYSNTDSADNQPAWKNAFEEILTAEELQQWETLLQDRTTNREKAAAGLMLSFVEEWVGLHQEQWEPILKLFRKHSEPVHSQFQEQHYYMNTSQVAQAIKGVDEKDLKKILNDSQWDRWEKAVEFIATRGQSQRSQRSGEGAKRRPGPDPLFVEEAITELIYERNRKKKEQVLMLMLAEIETGARAADLSPEAIADLRTAAKGATEEVVNQWDGNFVRYARGRVQGATPKTIHQQLGSVGNYSSRDADPKETTVWKKNLGFILDENQLKQWEAVGQQRKEARRDAVSELVAVYFEGSLGISGDQSTKFRGLLETSLEKYGPDIERYFSSHSSPWYFRYYSVALPLMGIPEKEWKALLSKEQMQTWEQQYQPNAANYWDNIQRYHEERMKSEKEEMKKNEAIKKNAGS